MKIMLDCSQRKISEYSDKFQYEFWQLRTPLTKYALAGVPYGLDNGCFMRFNEKIWSRLVREARETEPIFVCLPDIVGDAGRTLDLFGTFEKFTEGLPRALVLQNGIGNLAIPWDSISAVFVGGDDAFKVSTECISACNTAKMLGKWVHVGRVNTVSRLKLWMGLGDSIDGSGISRYDHMLENVLAFLKGTRSRDVS